ncbi:hypothetical protein B0H67DRAFT_594718 [Lasiosphaeris hirsuta]|uniref:Secreted protein n=1 Tax=Lasiosphaeris hirsuta TaxID=260670 RepID=A0AA39ZXX4_9PEZI|nr:hypothetical protein B0H67DRAFT_594718 [Lasiosphaeris hirsuta]
MTMWPRRIKAIRRILRILFMMRWFSTSKARKLELFCVFSQAAHPLVESFCLWSCRTTKARVSRMAVAGLLKRRSRAMTGGVCPDCREGGWL